MKIKKRHIKMARCADRARSNGYRYAIARGCSHCEAEYLNSGAEWVVVRWHRAANRR